MHSELGNVFLNVCVDVSLILHIHVHVATTLVGHKESIYSIAMNDSGTVLVSGSTEKVI